MHNKLMSQLNENLGISAKDFKNMINAVMQVFPMIILANLSKNTYSMIRNEGFLSWDIPSVGCFDDMIDEGVENIHPNYQNFFLECFSRENIIKNFENGKTDIYAELYQKNREGNYHWVSTHVIKVEDESGDIVEICLNRVLDGVVENTYGHRK